MTNLLTFGVQFLGRQLRSLPAPTTSYVGQTVIVTGANGGLGLEAARHFVRLGAARVILACRDTERGEAAKADIEQTVACSSSAVIEVWSLDLCSFDSVKDFCRRADKELERLDVLLANAGMLTVTAVKMAEGYEMQVTINVISTFLMVLMLLPLMKRTAARWNVEPAVTLVASDSHFLTRFVEKDEPRIFEAFRPGGTMHERYGTTKLIDMLVMQELAERLDAASAGASPVVVNTANPGMCKSNLFRDLPWIAKFITAPFFLLLGRTNEEGSRALMTAVAGGRESHAKYVDNCRIGETSVFVRSDEGKAAQKRVWDELMEILDGIEPGVSANVTQTPS